MDIICIKINSYLKLNKYYTFYVPIHLFYGKHFNIIDFIIFLSYYTMLILYYCIIHYYIINLYHFC